MKGGDVCCQAWSHAKFRMRSFHSTLFAGFSALKRWLANHKLDKYRSDAPSWAKMSSRKKFSLRPSNIIIEHLEKRFILDGVNVTAFGLTPTDKKSRGSHQEPFRGREIPDSHGHCLLFLRPHARQSQGHRMYRL
jgi:hypothetical protein